MKLITINR